MTEQELHRLSRKDLLELMLQQAKETEEIKTKYETKLNMIKTENEKEREILKKELEEAKKNLQNREIIINEAGSIAMAALQINGIFEAAQAAGQQYIENIRSINDRQAKICAQRENESRAEADEMLKEKHAYVEPSSPNIAADPVVQYMSKAQMEKSIERTRKLMQEAAKKLEFIEAAQYRNELLKLEDLMKEKWG